MRLRRMKVRYFTKLTLQVCAHCGREMPPLSELALDATGVMLHNIIDECSGMGKDDA